MKRLNADYGLMSSTNSFTLLPEAHLKVFSHMATLLHSIRLIAFGNENTSHCLHTL